MTRKARAATRAFALSAVRSDYPGVSAADQNPTDARRRERTRVPAITLEMGSSGTGGDSVRQYEPERDSSSARPRGGQRVRGEEPGAGCWRSTDEFDADGGNAERERGRRGGGWTRSALYLRRREHERGRRRRQRERRRQFRRNGETTQATPQPAAATGLGSTFAEWGRGRRYGRRTCSTYAGRAGSRALRYLPFELLLGSEFLALLGPSDRFLCDALRARRAVDEATEAEAWSSPVAS